MGEYILLFVFSTFLCLIINLIIKLITNSIAVKTVSVIYRNTDYLIFSEIFGRAFWYCYLADLIGFGIGSIALFVSDIIQNGAADWLISLSSYLFVFTASPYELPDLIILIFSVAVLMLLSFVFCYSKALTETDLSKKQRLISALIIALINAPYYFLITLNWQQGLP